MCLALAGTDPLRRREDFLVQTEDGGGVRSVALCAAPGDRPREVIDPSSVRVHF